ncbi:MAG: ATPase [Clostridia bacterium]|nr:ATPase [Clostridia bacterium]
MKKILGIELGSTRIKAVLTDENANVLAVGIYSWENRLVDGLWSYPLEQALEGLAAGYASMAEDYRQRNGKEFDGPDAIGISGMMHGYLALDKNDRLLVPFRTWRNTNTEKAAAELSEAFRFNMPMRWSAAQYYQAVLSGEPHVPQVAKLMTLAGYIHYKLTGRFVSGIGEASGMFPVKDGDYNAEMLAKMGEMLKAHGAEPEIKKLLPQILKAGENAGTLTEDGAKLLDPSGKLKAGVPLCPPEGDMQTGMVCSDTIAPGEANFSAGTSCNIVVTLEKPLEGYRKEIDVLLTPEGYDAAMIHGNNCTSEIDNWVRLFAEVAAMCGANVSKGKLYDLLYAKSLEGDGDSGGVIGYNYLAGEAIAGAETGALVVARKPSGRLTLANFMQMQVFSAVSAIALGFDLLAEAGVKLTAVTAAGGFYKTEFVGQNATSALFRVPVTVMQTAGEGGAWGMALLATYMLERDKYEDLSAFLRRVFSGVGKSTVMASDKDIEKFGKFFALYKQGLPAELLMAELFAKSGTEG